MKRRKISSLSDYHTRISNLTFLFDLSINYFHHFISFKNKANEKLLWWMDWGNAVDHNENRQFLLLLDEQDGGQEWQTHCSVGAGDQVPSQKGRQEHNWSKGKRVDWHLYALKWCIGDCHRMHSSPPMYGRRSIIPSLSESNCGNPALRLFGRRQPVTYVRVWDGIIIKDNGVQYAFSNKHWQTRMYTDDIHSSDSLWNWRIVGAVDKWMW